MELTEEDRKRDRLIHEKMLAQSDAKASPGTVKQAMDVVVHSRAVMANKMPFFALAMASMTPVSCPGLYRMASGAVGVDKWGRLYFDPNIVAEWKYTQCLWWMHELGHLMRKHFSRHDALMIPAVFHKTALLAQDCELEDDITEGDGLTRAPYRGCHPSLYDLPVGRMWEEYYQELRSRVKFIHVSLTCGGGSGTGSVICSWEQGPPDGKNAPGLTAPEMQAVRRETARLIKEHASRGRGVGAGGWLRWADDVLEPPQVNWRAAVGAMVRRCIHKVSGSADYSYRRPHKRSDVTGLPLPVMVKPVPRIALVCDTSGSMGTSQLNTVRAETEGCCKAAGAQIIVFSVDAEVHGVQEITSARQMKLKGGGGTDMRVGIAAALAHKPRVDFIAVVTDGYTPWPDQPLRAKIIAIIVDGPNSAPPWMPAVLVKSAEARADEQKITPAPTPSDPFSPDDDE